MEDPPNKPTLISPADDTPSLIGPADGSQHYSAAPTLSWNSINGSQVEYFAEIFDGPVYDKSEWITTTTWRPSQADGKPGVYNWHVKAIDWRTGKQSGWGPVWKFTINKSQSTDLRLDIRMTQYGKSITYVDITSRVRPYVINDQSINVKVDNSLCGYDPLPNVVKELIVTYRNRWNEEWRVTVPEGSMLSLTRDSRVGTYLLDGDD